ncbi:alpha/beta hydrolase [Streptosporangium canum]|uniref:alpha/beta hydrolase n=1 Tax=Streptosporangium canum TaxID=324952 RepID=UPI0033A8C748
MGTGPDPAAGVETRRFLGRRAETDDVVGGLSVESQAALRQFSFERTLAYGVEYADAVELRARVLDGQGWKDAASELARVCLDRAPAVADGLGGPTRAAYLRRASALTRMSQVMMLSDTDERREIYGRAVDLYAGAAEIAGDRERFTVATDEGLLTGWHLPAGPDAVGSAIVIGGVEGWAMDFDTMGEALAARGIEAFLLDAPGQGESRMRNGVYLTPQWLRAYRQVVDEVDSRAPGRPIGMIGNSIGGSFAMALAAADTRITACCDNGGIATPGLVPPGIGTFFTKMMAFCDCDDEQETTAIWSSVDSTADGPNSGYPLLVVHGGRDPLVSDPLVQMVLDLVPTDDHEMVVFTDGDHCIYNHREDRDLLVADWMRARLAPPAPGQG